MAIKKSETEVSILEIQRGEIEVCIVGDTPMILNCMSEKAKHELLFPQGRKTGAARAQSMKHIPIDEYRNSVYRMDDGPTRLFFPATGFKRALATAALDIPGAKKAQIGRLVWVVGDKVALYGVPQLHMSVVRSADTNRTPDVRTRAILPQWACRLRIQFVKPAIRDQSVVNLLAAAGITVGVGDFRQEKGAGSYGQFSLVDADDERFLRIMETGDREAQDAALEDPEMYDIETEKLFSWFKAEVIKLTGKVKESA